MVLNVDENIVLSRNVEQLLVVFKQLDRWFRNQYVYATFNGVERDREVSRVRGKDSD